MNELREQVRSDKLIFLVLVGFLIISFDCSSSFSSLFNHPRPSNKNNTNFDRFLDNLSDTSEVYAPLSFEPIVLNNASVELIATIPGIGIVLANKIHAYLAENKHDLRLSDLVEIDGVGDAKLKEIAIHARLL